jgi:hypothetical protein
MKSRFYKEGGKIKMRPTKWQTMQLAHKANRIKVLEQVLTLKKKITEQNTLA